MLKKDNPALSLATVYNSVEALCGAGLLRRINVDDNGCGVPAEIQDRIFERGFSTKTEKKENHGIGLDSVNTIIKNCKGIIEIDSAVGEGTSISIRINQKRWVLSPENIAGEKEQ